MVQNGIVNKDEHKLTVENSEDIGARGKGIRENRDKTATSKRDCHRDCH